MAALDGVRLDTMSPEEMKSTIGGSNAHRRLVKAWQGDHIKTIRDLELATYGFAIEPDGRIAKDAAVTIDTTGLTNNLYGAKLYRQITTGWNALGAIGFKPWQRNGYRTITAAASTASPGMALGGAIPATLKPTAANIDITPKLQAISFEEDSTSLKVSSSKNDGVSWEEFAAYMADEFKNRMNRAFLKDADTVTSTGIDTLDRVIASYAEIAYGKMDDSAVLDANDLDIYSQDRDAAASVYDAYVNGLAFGSADHTFELSYLDACFTNCRPYWENRMNSNKVIITQDDTGTRISQLHAAMGTVQVPQKRVQFTVNGVQSVAGADVGVEVAAYNGVPIIYDEHVLQDTIGRIYLVDQDNLHIGAVTPPTMLVSDDFQALDKFAQEGVWYMEGEIVCTKFGAQGKVRDLK